MTKPDWMEWDEETKTYRGETPYTIEIYLDTTRPTDWEPSGIDCGELTGQVSIFREEEGEPWILDIEYEGNYGSWHQKTLKCWGPEPDWDEVEKEMEEMDKDAQSQGEEQAWNYGKSDEMDDEDI